MFIDDLLKRSVKLYPNEEAIVFEEKRVTYRDLQKRVNKIASAILKLGTKREERIAVLSGNNYQYVELYFAIPKTGSVLTTVNFRLKPAEILYILNDCEAEILIIEDRYFDLIAPIKQDLKFLKNIIVIGKKIEGCLDYEELLNSGSEIFENENRSEDDVCFQLYTSGTTGRPKGAMTTHKNWIFDVTGCALLGEFNHKDRYLIPAPLFHAAAGIATVLGIMNSVTLILIKDFMPDVVLNIIEKEKVTRALFIPAMINFLLQMPEVEKKDFSNLKTIVYGASPISETLLRKAKEVFKCDFWQAFGQTESVAVLASLLPEEHIFEGEKTKLLKSCGRQIPFCEVKVVNENDEEVKPGEVGEVIAKGPNVMKGYFKLPEETAETLKNGWLHTGDLATVDNEGYIYIVDRKKDMIISGGENIYPAEIEEVIAKHPAVLEVAVIGIPDEVWGEGVCAVVSKKIGMEVNEEEIINFCKEHLGGYKIPKKVDFVNMLPRNPSMKVLKTVLREPYWKDKGRRVH